MKKLIVNADDFGLTEGINRGIITGYKEGIITSTSLITTMPAFDDAVEKALKHPQLDIGVHVTLTLGRPCSDEGNLSVLLDEGEFIQNYGEVLRCICFKRVDPTDIQTEISAQIRKVRKAGLRVSHLNGHQHVHMSPSLFKIIKAVVKEYDIPFVRVPDRFFRTKRWKSKELGFILLGLVAMMQKRKYGLSGVKSADYFRGLSCSENLSLQELMRILGSLKHGANELMCHPGYEDDALKEVYGDQFFREEELQALTSQIAKSSIEQNNIQLTSFSEINRRTVRC